MTISLDLPPSTVHSVYLLLSIWRFQKSFLTYTNCAEGRIGVHKELKLLQLQGPVSMWWGRQPQSTVWNGTGGKGVQLKGRQSTY